MMSQYRITPSASGCNGSLHITIKRNQNTDFALPFCFLTFHSNTKTSQTLYTFRTSSRTLSHNTYFRTVLTNQLVEVHCRVHACCHWSLSWASRIQFTSSHPISLRFILILSSYLHIGLPCGSSLQVFRRKFCMHFSFL